MTISIDIVFATTKCVDKPFVAPRMKLPDPVRPLNDRAGNSFQNALHNYETSRQG
jgi:hypothetical protein